MLKTFAHAATCTLSARLVRHWGGMSRIRGTARARAGGLEECGRNPNAVGADRDDPSGLDAEIDVGHVAVIVPFGTDRTGPSAPGGRVVLAALSASLRTVERQFAQKHVTHSPAHVRRRARRTQSRGQWRKL